MKPGSEAARKKKAEIKPSWQGTQKDWTIPSKKVKSNTMSKATRVRKAAAASAAKSANAAARKTTSGKGTAVKRGTGR